MLEIDASTHSLIEFGKDEKSARMHYENLREPKTPFAALMQGPAGSAAAPNATRVASRTSAAAAAAGSDRLTVNE